MTTIITIILITSLLSGLFSCLLQDPVYKFKCFIKYKLYVYRRLKLIERGHRPEFTGLTLTKKQIIWIKSKLPDNEEYQRYYEMWIKSRYLGDQSELP